VVSTQKIDGKTGRQSAYKARWVARGYTRIAGLDYNKLDASVAHKDFVCVLLSLVNHLDVKLDQVEDLSIRSYASRHARNSVKLRSFAS